ncbi:MAG: IclR family transcriptional regulator, partial [Pseudomonadota bacterium]|nr:IclR family transcriptional regulator [Pseudomonadota bacterium]
TAGRPLTVAELVVLLDVPKPTMHRIVRQLDHEGLLMREPQSRGYGPGPRLFNFAINVVQTAMRSGPRHAVLSKLSARTGETCNFGMISGNAAVYLDRIEAAWPFGLKFEPGSRVPLHCTSMGKLFLAYQPKRRRDQLLHGGSLYRYTKNTITDPDELESQFVAIRKRGYSIDDQEFLDGVICLAVPVHDNKGQVCAAIAISAPQARMQIEDAERHVPEMLKAVSEVEGFLNESHE